MRLSRFTEAEKALSKVRKAAISLPLSLSQSPGRLFYSTRTRLLLNLASTRRQALELEPRNKETQENIKILNRLKTTEP
jgi:hypothetical protein